MASDKSARPAREHEHKQNHGKQSRTGCRGGVSLDLNQVHRKQKKENSDSGIQKKCEQIRPTEVAGFEQPERQCRLTRGSLDKYEDNKANASSDQTSENQRISPASLGR